MADNIEKAFLNYMLADAALVAEVSTRVYPYSRPQGSALPAVTSQRISGGPLAADDGGVGLSNVRMQIDCWAISYGAAKDLANLITVRLSAVRDVTQSGIVFRYIMLDREQDIREGGANEFTYEYRVIQEYTVWYG